MVQPRELHTNVKIIPHGQFFVGDKEGGTGGSERACETVPALLIIDLTISTDQPVTANELIITAIPAVSILCTKRMRKLMIQSNYNMQRTGDLINHDGDEEIFNH